MDEVIRKLNSLITFFKPSTVEIKEIKDVQDAVDFDLQSYLNAYKAGLDEVCVLFISQVFDTIIAL